MKFTTGWPSLPWPSYRPTSKIPESTGRYIHILTRLRNLTSGIKAGDDAGCLADTGNDVFLLVVMVLSTGGNQRTGKLEYHFVFIRTFWFPSLIFISTTSL